MLLWVHFNSAKNDDRKTVVEERQTVLLEKTLFTLCS